MARVRDTLVSIPIGRTDLIPSDYEVVDKRINIPVDFPPNLLKKACSMSLNLDNFFDLISLKPQFKFIFLISYKHYFK